MKIACSQDEKERLIKAFRYSSMCPFNDDVYEICSGNCDECEQIEKQIEWETEAG